MLVVVTRCVHGSSTSSPCLNLWYRIIPIKGLQQLACKGTYQEKGHERLWSMTARAAIHVALRRKWIGWVDECRVHQWVSPHFPNGFACPNAFALMCTGLSAAFKPLGATRLWIILPQSQTEFEVFTPWRTVRDRAIAVHASKLLT